MEDQPSRPLTYRLTQLTAGLLIILIIFTSTCSCAVHFYSNLLHFLLETPLKRAGCLLRRKTHPCSATSVRRNLNTSQTRCVQAELFATLQSEAYLCPIGDRHVNEFRCVLLYEHFQSTIGSYSYMIAALILILGLTIYRLRGWE